MDVDGVEQFRRHACGYWEAIDGGDAESATGHTTAAEAIAGGWPEPARGQSLAALMDDADSRVRYAAAACSGPGERAEATLADLADEPTGLIAPTAKLLLMQWRGRT